MKLGWAFSDAVTHDQHTRSKRMADEAPWWAGAGRALLFATLFCIAFFVLGWRLFDLSIVHGREFRKLSDGNKTRELIRHAPRGILLDRTGKPLVVNTYGDMDYVRSYPFGDALAHAVGYTGELSAEELKSEYYSLRNYGLGDRVGRMGAEAVYNERLRGRDGKELVEVDAAGRAIRSLGRQEEVPGDTITLSFDAALSRVAAAAFPAGYKGAIVVTKPTTGEVLVLYSSPGFSPNEFFTGMSEDVYQTLVNNPDLPMFNRVLGGVYPPGSTFKIVTALAGLEGGEITRQTIVDDNGSITIGPFTFPNWYFLQYGKTEGPVDLIKALQRSNDIFFYKAGEWIGITKLAQWARTVGIGKPLGIELSGEAGGLMPDPAWKNTQFDTTADKLARNNDWYLGDTYHVSIGQGYLLVTPLQVNAWTNVIANGGKLCRPTIEKTKKVTCKDLGVQKKTIDTIIEGMRRACDTGGTGWPFFNFQITNPNDQTKKSIPIACKTGTAEFGDPDDNTHAWFTAFAPLRQDFAGQGPQSDNLSIISGEPEISVTVLVEGAGEGSSVAAPIAKKILEAWFGR